MRLEGIDGPNAICPECSKNPWELESLREQGYPDVRLVPGTSVLIPAPDGRGGICWWDSSLEPPEVVQFPVNLR